MKKTAIILSLFLLALLPVSLMAFTISGPTSGTIGFTATYTAEALASCSTAWTITGGTIVSPASCSGGTTCTTTGQTITVKWNCSSGGTHRIDATRPGAFCVGNGTLNVTVTAVTMTPGAISGAATSCPLVNQVYSIPTVANATSYTWSAPGGTILSGGTTNSVTVQWANPGGTRTITVTPQHNGCNGATSSSKTVTVTTLISTVGAIAGPSGVCQGSTGNVYTISPVANATTYTWTLPPGGSITAGSNTNSITVSYSSSASSGNVTVTPSNSCGSGALRTYAVTVSNLPSAAGVITGPASVCIGGGNASYSIAAVAGATGYTWTPSGGTVVTGAGSTAVTVNWTTAGLRTLTVTPTNSCGNGVASNLSVRVYAVPAAHPDTLNLLHANLSSATVQTLVIDHCVNNHPCTPQTMVSSKVYFKLSTGDDYEYGSNAFSTGVTLNLTAKDAYTGGSTVISSVQAMTLNQNAPEQWYVWDITGSYASIHRIDISFTGYTASTLVQGTLKLKVYNETEFATAAGNAAGTPWVTVNTVNTTPSGTNKLTFSWTTTCVSFPNYEFQLLRLYNTDVAKAEAGVNTTVTVDVDWNKALTIETQSSATSLQLAVTEGTGYYVWRVRPIGNYHAGGIANDLNWGAWSGTGALVQGATVALTAAISPHCFFYQQHEANLNWRYSRVFSDGDADKKGFRVMETIQYANGITQPKQTQVLQSTTSQVLASQTIYDYTGRAAISVLGAPIPQSYFQYVTQLVQQTPGTLYTAAHFDGSTTSKEPLPVSAGPIATYYSSSTPSGENTIPDAQGYPFSRTYFYGDGTDRVRASNAPGIIHRFQNTIDGNDRATRMFYAGVAEAELLRIFGDEAPHAYEVKKHISLDPNGTATVAYINSMGQTLATCVSAGHDASKLDDLSETHAVLSVRDFITEAVSLPQGEMSSKPVAIVQPTNLKVYYSITPQSITAACGSFCASCDYKVYFILHNLTDPSAAGYPRKDSLSIAGGSCPGTASGLTPFIQYNNLPAGSYMVERRLYTGNINPVTGVAYVDEAAAAYRAELATEMQGVLDNLLAYQATNDLDGLNAYLDAEPDMTLDASGEFYNLPTACATIRIPFEHCDAPDCGSTDFEGMLTTRWGPDTSLGLGMSVTAYFASSWGLAPGNFNTLVANMLADPNYDYSCEQLFNCWKGIVEGYKSTWMLYNSMGRVYDPLEQFLDCTGRHLKKVSSTKMTTSYTTPGYLSHAYLSLNGAAGVSATCINSVNQMSANIGAGLVYPYPDTAQWHWLQLLDCNSSFAPDSTSWTASTLADSVEADCRSVCEARYPGFVESLKAAYRADSRYVIAGEGTPGPGQTLITLEMIYCSAQQLVADCEAGCNLTVLTSPTPYPHATQVGTAAEQLAIEQRMTWGYEVSLPDALGACTSGFTSTGGSATQPSLLSDYLNGELEAFRATMGAGTTSMNIYNLVQCFDATLISGTSCFTPTTSVSVSSSQNSFFYEKTCVLHYVTPLGTDLSLCSGICATTSCPQVCFRWVQPEFSGDADTVSMVSCEAHTIDFVISQYEAQMEAILDAAVADYKSKYISECSSPGSSQSYSIEYNLDYYHYTLYYYDRAGNKIRSVPPGGVALLDVSLPAVQNREVHPAHTFVTEFEYNSLGQLIRTKAPDQGENKLYYNRAGQLRFTQNSDLLAGSAYTYTKYDGLGRTVETGRSTLSGGGGAFIAQVDNSTFPGTGTLKSLMVYSTPTGVSYSGTQPQRFLLNNVAQAYTDDDGNLATTTDQVHTHYSYTPQGFVEWMIQDLPELGQQKMLYDVDPGSGVMRKVICNEGKVDQFFHRYHYDADNRLTVTESSTDGVIWDRDYSQKFFAHGGTSRVMLGEDRVQGVDYVYTLNNLIKGINHPSLVSSNDPGLDGQTGSANAKFAKDVFGTMLNYFREDFRNGSSPFNADVSNSYFLLDREYFNGYVSASTSNLKAMGGMQLEQNTGYTYRYDVLGRLKQAQMNKYVTSAFTAVNDYKCNYTYDANGNILTQVRNGYSSAGLTMDNLTYNYTAGTNKLAYVSDAAGTTATYSNDFEGQLAGNYGYDAIGRRVTDVKGLTTTTWNFRDKVQNVFIDNSGTSNDQNLGMQYDASGNRVVKKQSLASGTHLKTTFYVHDATGNPVAVYQKTIVVDTTFYRLVETPLYAGTRIGQNDRTVLAKKVVSGVPATITLAPANGVYTRKTAQRQFELRDHLGNVRATVSDLKQPVNPANLSLGFNATVMMEANYDPFGAEQPGRMYSANDYRIGFNGMEKDDEITGEGNNYTAMFWQYDSRLGRRWNTDPVVNPSESPYATFRNNPVSYTDVKGDRPKYGPGVVDRGENSTWGEKLQDRLKNWWSGRKQAPVPQPEAGMTPVDPEPEQSEPGNDNGDGALNMTAAQPTLPEFRFDYSQWFIGLNYRDNGIVLTSADMYFMQFPNDWHGVPVYTVEAQMELAPDGSVTFKYLSWYNNMVSPLMAYMKACNFGEDGRPLEPEEEGAVFMASGFSNGIPYGTMGPLLTGPGQPMKALRIPCPPRSPNVPVPVPVPVPYGNRIGIEVPTAIAIYKGVQFGVQMGSTVIEGVGSVLELGGAILTSPLLILSTPDLLKPEQPDPPGTGY